MQLWICRTQCLHSVYGLHVMTRDSSSISSFSSISFIHLLLYHSTHLSLQGLSRHVVLTEQMLSHQNVQTQPESTRRKFVDEYVYERLFLASKPFTATILKALAVSRRDRCMDCSTSSDDSALKVAMEKKPSMHPLLLSDEERAPSIKRVNIHASCSQIPTSRNIQGQILPFCLIHFFATCSKSMCI